MMSSPLYMTEETIYDLEALASTIERSKTFIVRKAIESYLKYYADYWTQHLQDRFWSYSRS
ncbi:MAG: hypothetical protein LAKADJCE_00591 [Candidatus Argoarchaeum ethanivorans]|uniref:Ribbon-helix-helix protein CopG domain-containing protein n=1 Tax=Candidatus Argoarchaeum ethanivorans TaxID=2608793 RepID=A0A811TDV8_9EURY|nr:MAG: hypothetical protein LAKADJCE_00591 [Candidatus Argoarchaeum ethanivorans]